MSDDITKRVPSGEKFRNERGMAVIKDGIKQRKTVEERPETTRKPQWLRAQIPGGGRFEAVKKNVNEHRLSTVCAESHCPNMGECWSNGTATIMLMGSVCTRACRFCAVDTGNPRGWLDAEEPANTAKSVELMGLRYVVLTSVDRDDLPDGGAAHYAACIQAIKTNTPQVVVEALTPTSTATQRPSNAWSIPALRCSPRTSRRSSDSLTTCATRVPAIARRSTCWPMPSATAPTC